jgi:hypothetical protein
MDWFIVLVALAALIAAISATAAILSLPKSYRDPRTDNIQWPIASDQPSDIERRSDA